MVSGYDTCCYSNQAKESLILKVNPVNKKKISLIILCYVFLLLNNKQVTHSNVFSTLKDSTTSTPFHMAANNGHFSVNIKNWVILLERLIAL